jgi:hypothetical protein
MKKLQIASSLVLAGQLEELEKTTEASTPAGFSTGASRLNGRWFQEFTKV